MRAGDDDTFCIYVRNNRLVGCYGCGKDACCCRFSGARVDNMVPGLAVVYSLTLRNTGSGNGYMGTVAVNDSVNDLIGMLCVFECLCANIHHYRHSQRK